MVIWYYIPEQSKWVLWFFVNNTFTQWGFIEVCCSNGFLGYDICPVTKDLLNWAKIEKYANKRYDVHVTLILNSVYQFVKFVFLISLTLYCFCYFPDKKERTHRRTDSRESVFKYTTPYNLLLRDTHKTILFKNANSKTKVPNFIPNDWQRRTNIFCKCDIMWLTVHKYHKREIHFLFAISKCRQCFNLAV